MNCGFPLVGKETGVWGPSNMEITFLVERSPWRKGAGRDPQWWELIYQGSDAWCWITTDSCAVLPPICSKPLVKIYCCVHGSVGEQRRSSGRWCGTERGQRQQGEARSQNRSREDGENVSPLETQEVWRWCWVSHWEGSCILLSYLRKGGLRKAKGGHQPCS